MLAYEGAWQNSDLSLPWGVVRVKDFMARSPSEAFPVQGTASVIDGDTLEVHGQRIRLHGIDAPESAQLCHDAAGQTWRCGQRAALALADKIGRQTIACDPRDVDRYGRIVAVCHLGAVDLNAWTVAQGWALAYHQYSRDYVGAESSARAGQHGIWSGTFDAPWDWRKNPRSSGSSSAANRNQPRPAGTGCKIKGNISSEGERIYHIPNGRWYDRARINEAKGERWFCDEAQAQAAGWRPSRQ